MAMRTARRLLLALLATLVAAQTTPSAQSKALVFRNVTLIDGTGAAAQPGTTVVVTGNRITAVGSNAAVPQGAQVVDGTGKFLIPGLWDMHLHLRGDSRVPRFTTYGEVLMIANGVTGARIMAGLPKFHQIQKTNESGETLRPASLPCEPQLRRRDSNPEAPAQVGRHRRRSRGMAVGRAG